MGGGIAGRIGKLAGALIGIYVIVCLVLWWWWDHEPDQFAVRENAAVMAQSVLQGVRQLLEVYDENITAFEKSHGIELTLLRENLMDFGAFVTILPGKDGLVHVSQICEERVENVSDKLSEGEMVKVKVLAIDDRGKVRLSMRVVDQETGQERVSEDAS